MTPLGPSLEFWLYDEEEEEEATGVGGEAGAEAGEGCVAREEEADAREAAKVVAE